MLRLQLYIEEQEIELFKDESITLTQSIQDVKDISKVFTDYTKTFAVPASRNNNKVFKHFYNFNINGYDPRFKKSAELHLNYKLYKKGKIKLETSELQENKPHTYKVTFYGDMVTLKDTLDKDQLGVLTELKAGNFDYTDANIKTYMADGLDITLGSEVITDAIVFPLLTHTGNLGWKDDTSNFSDGSYNLYGVAGGSNGVPLTELKPAIKVYALVRAIEIHYPELTFSTDFFSSTNDVFYGLYMWCHNREGTMFGDWTSYPVSFDTGNVTGDIDVLGAPRTNFYPNNTDSNLFPRNMEVKVTPTDTDDEYNLVIKKDGVEFKRFDGLTNETINGGSGNTSLPYFGIETGDYTFFIESKTANTFTTQVTIREGNTFQLIRPKRISFTGSTTVGSTKKVDIVSHLPKIKIIDLLTGLFKMFNLTAYLDTNGTINIKTLDSYYSDSDTYWNITEYLDKKSKTVNTIIPYKRVTFGYEGTGTYLANQHEDLAKLKWGELDYQASTDKKTEGQTYEVKVPFEHMKFQKIRNETTGTFKPIIFGRAVDPSLNPFLGKPILFYINSSLLSLGVLGDIAVRTQAGATETVSQPYMPSNHLNSMCTYNTTTSVGAFSGITFDKQNLHFNGEMSEMCLSPNLKTLFDTYYQDYVTDLFDDRKRLTIIKAYLPLKITEQITLADKIIIVDDVYKINKFTTNFENNLSTLELTNTIDKRSYQTSVWSLSCDLTADSDKPLNDSSLQSVTTDNDCVQSGFDFGALDLTSLTPFIATLPQQTTNQPCTVTAPVYSNFTIITTGTTFFTVTWNVDTAGTICGVDSVMEHGIFVSTTENDFKDSTTNYITDIDTLIDNATSSGTLNSFRSTGTSNSISGNSLTGGNQSTPQDFSKLLVAYGLSSNTTYYYKFYIRTVSPTLAPQYNIADVQSDVLTIKTAAS